MQFEKTIGKIDPALKREAEEKLSAVFTELSLNYTNRSSGSKLGGDPFIFQLVYPIQQICVGDEGKVGNSDRAITTAATDGKRYYWNAEFVKSLSRIGLRLVIAHEAFHAIYMHPQRRGGRHPWLWNIAVDYIVNYNILADLKSRGFDGPKLFNEHLGEFIELKKYGEILSGKIKPSKKDEEKKCFFADPNLPENLRKPEAIYEYLYNQIPKCPKCGKRTPGQQQASGQQSKNQKGQKGQKNGQGQNGQQDQDGKGKNKNKGNGQGQNQDGQSGGHQCGGQGHDHEGDGDGDGQGNQPGQGNQSGQGQGQGGGGHSCDHGNEHGPLGELLDDHLDADATQDELAKRLADAAEISRRLAGTIPAGMQDELGTLLAPKMRWQDVIRSKIQKVRQGHGRNDWNRFKTRQLMAGVMIPKRKEFYAKFRVLLDTSGSMSQEDMTWGISQLQAIDERGEGTITPADCTIYWDDTVTLKKANREELSKVKVVGRGGTMFANFFDEYEKRLGEADFIIMITDGYLLNEDLAAMKKPKCPVYWLLTASHNFSPPFGRVLSLRNE